MTVVIDAAALMALLLDEPGAPVVMEVVRGSLMSVVNLSEACSRGVERGARADDVLMLARACDITMIGCDMAQAIEAARLRGPTKSAGLSLGDRMCLALATLRNGVIYTSDRRLGSFHQHLGVDIRLIR